MGRRTPGNRVFACAPEDFAIKSRRPFRVQSAKCRLVKTRSGLTLLEVLVALIVLLVGIGGMIALYGAAASRHRLAKDQQTVARLARAVLSDVQSDSRDFQNAANLTHREFPERFRYDLEFEPLSAELGEYRVRVTIRWKQAGREHEETFETILLRSAGS